LGQKKAKVSVFNGSVVYFNVGIGLTFLGRSCSTRQELYFYLFRKLILAVKCRWVPEPRGQFEIVSENPNHLDFDERHSKGGGGMSWRAQNRSKDAKTPSVGPAMFEKPELG
jgi:hypothetical protein